MKQKLQELILVSCMCTLGLTWACVSCEPAAAQSLALGDDFLSLDVENGEVNGSTIFGHHLNNTQSIALGGTLVALICSAFLFQRVILRTCNCCCGPGKCECGCGCKSDCPCFYRDKSEHNDQARRRHYDWY